MKKSQSTRGLVKKLSMIFMLLTPAAAFCAANLPQDQPASSPAGPKFHQNSGAALYASICAGCHMPHGEGARGAGFYPAAVSSSP